MARKSRRNKSTEVNISQDIVKNKNLLDTAIYVRLSVENGGNETDETLVVQQMLVEKYIEEHPDLRLAGTYSDNGFSGTNFDRPGFIKLMEDVKTGKIQCIVVKDLFAHLREPAVVIRRDSVTFNTACIAGLEDAVYIQILVNQENKRMVVRKCKENDKDALRWCVAKPDKRKSRKMTNKIFSAMMYEMMGWNLDCRYKILGHKISFEGETIYVFDLMETEIYLDTKGKRQKKNAENQENAESSNNIEGTSLSNASEDNTSTEEINKKTRTPFYPKEWKDSFGLPVEEHKKALEINMLKGYAEFTTPK